MPKEERRRQRRLARQGAEEGSENLADVSTTDVEATSAPVSGSVSGDHSSAPASASESEPEKKPIALAQILANPSYVERLRPGTDANSPIQEPRMERLEPNPEPIGVNTSREEDVMSREPPNSPGDERAVPPADTRSQGAPVRARPTREPLIIALLLLALIVLAVDTYFTLRLNGLSDRLSALAAKSAAPVVTAADRPWVGVDTIETAQFANGGQPITTVHIVNSGRQPAYDLRSNTVGSLRAVATAPPQVPAQKGPLATTGMLMPNTGGKLTFFGNTRALTADEAANVKKGQYVLWLAGRLDYKDAAGHAHVTTFRYRYDPTLNSFIAAPQGNSAN
jgi:hypothetical protein